MDRTPRAPALLLTLLCACTPDPPPPPIVTPWVSPGAHSARHLILISVDTLRADHLTPYGAPPGRTPFLSQLAAEGVTFTDHLATAPTTLTSHTSLMTGLWPHNHGVARNGFSVAPENLTLAEILTGEGFLTAGFVGALPLASRSGFAQGFAHFDETFDPDPGCGDLAVEQAQRPANQVTDAALSWLDAKAPSERLFLFLHYFDPHAPYAAPGAFRAMYRGDAARVDGSLDEQRATRDAWPKGGHELSEGLQRAYEAEVTYTDRELGRLLDGLDARGILDEAIVIFTADHGESFTEHWEIWNHGWSVYGETTWLPLVVRMPDGQGGQRVDALTSAVDVLPTALSLLDVEAPARLDGRSFAAALTGGQLADRGVVFTEATKPRDEAVEAGHLWANTDKCKAARDQRWKYVECPLKGTRELYDLTADPGEQVDLLKAAAPPLERADALQQALRAWTASAAPPESGFAADEDTIEGLKALGYLE